MRVAFLSLDFGLLLLALVALVHVQGITASENNDCPTEICAPAEHCEWPVHGGKCAGGNKCCSLLKSEHRTLCRHHGGTCMDHCNPRLAQRSTDCPAGTQCCVLV